MIGFREVRFSSTDEDGTVLTHYAQKCFVIRFAFPWGKKKDLLKKKWEPKAPIMQNKEVRQNETTMAKYNEVTFGTRRN